MQRRFVTAMSKQFAEDGLRHCGQAGARLDWSR